MARGLHGVVSNEKVEEIFNVNSDMPKTNKIVRTCIKIDSAFVEEKLWLYASKYSLS